MKWKTRQKLSWRMQFVKIKESGWKENDKELFLFWT